VPVIQLLDNEASHQAVACASASSKVTNSLMSANGFYSPFKTCVIIQGFFVVFATSFATAFY
jgi:hypothetical protein